MLQTILVVLTTVTGGPPHLSLAPVAAAEDCPARAGAIGAVLEEAGTEVLAIRCAETQLRVTPYVPGAGPDDFVHRWRIELGDEAVELAPLAGGEACEPAEGVVCAVSAQSVAAPE